MADQDRTAALKREPGERLEGRLLGDRYRLRERIDAGGAGEVWLARDERLDRDVALKLLSPDADDAFRTRFTQEARRAAAVVHPNVVTIYDEGRDGAETYMVMEYVRGRTLRDIIRDRGALPAHEAARLVGQVAAALDAAHAADVIHCDVKPANVIVSDAGTAKLTDFGVARAARDREEQELVGTARYIAPERIEGGPATAASDVYSLGLVAYELLAGQPAYAGAETDELIRLRLDGAPPSLRSMRLGVPPEVDRVLQRALARDAADRFQSAGAFARALSGAAERGEETAVLGTPVAARPLARPRTRRDLPISGTLALLALLILLVATIAFFAQFQRADVASQRGAGPTAPAAARTVPNVIGKNVNEAAGILLSAGLRGEDGQQAIPWEVDPRVRGTACTVVRQEPAAGASFDPAKTAAKLYLYGPCGGGKGGKKDD